MARDARVHPQTVTAYSRGEVGTVVQRRYVNGKSSRPVTIKVDLRVWKVALKLAGRDLALIEVKSPTEVIVHHTPEWRKRR